MAVSLSQATLSDSESNLSEYERDFATLWGADCFKRSDRHREEQQQRFSGSCMVGLLS